MHSFLKTTFGEETKICQLVPSSYYDNDYLLQIINNQGIEFINLFKTKFGSWSFNYLTPEDIKKYF